MRPAVVIDWLMLHQQSSVPAVDFFCHLSQDHLWIERYHYRGALSLISEAFLCLVCFFWRPSWYIGRRNRGNELNVHLLREANDEERILPDDMREAILDFI